METLITSPEIERYIQNLYPIEDPLLIEMGELGSKINFPLVGPLVGRLLYQFSKLISAKKVFEMGSGFGYSAFWFALALPENGIMHLTDQSQKNSDLAKHYFLQGNLSHKAKFHVGDAGQVPGPALFPDQPERADAVFDDDRQRRVFRSRCRRGALHRLG